MAASRAFYQDIIGMKVVWEPDADNLYLSLGCDNLALHVAPATASSPHEPPASLWKRVLSCCKMTSPPPQRRTSAVARCPAEGLDHIGFIVGCKEDVDFMARKMEQLGVPLAKPVRLHRDGSYSFYIDDPDGNRVQILYEPHITNRNFRYGFV